MKKCKILRFILVGFFFSFFGCIPEQPQEDGDLIPPDTEYECSAIVLDINNDTLYREKYDILEGNPSPHGVFYYSTIAGSNQNQMTLPRWKGKTIPDHLSIGDFRFDWYIKYFTFADLDFEEVEPGVFSDLSQTTEAMYQYILDNIDVVNKAPYKFELKIRYYDDTLDREFNNSFFIGEQIKDVDDRLNVNILNFDTLQVHGQHSSQYFTQFIVDATFDGWLFTDDDEPQDSMFIKGEWDIPIYANGYHSYEE